MYFIGFTGFSFSFRAFSSICLCTSRDPFLVHLMELINDFGHACSARLRSVKRIRLFLEDNRRASVLLSVEINAHVVTFKKELLRPVWLSTCQVLSACTRKIRFIGKPSESRRNFFLRTSLITYLLDESLATSRIHCPLLGRVATCE